uniref:Uncharacterized protein n=1 Tax=viral metagenome TaxID=1070528 RepID=A0A6M3XQM3_9ZZZZ
MKKVKNNTKKDLIIGGVAIAVLVLMLGISQVKAEISIMDRLLQIAGNVWGNRLPVPEAGEVSFGAFPGPDIYADISIHGTLQQGGGCWATTTAGSVSGTNADLVLTEKNMLDYNCFEMTFSTASSTVTLPATSTMASMLKDKGDVREWYFHNVTTTAGLTLTIAAGSGIDLIGVTTADDVIDETEYARLTCWRNASVSAATDVTCIVSELLAVD